MSAVASGQELATSLWQQLCHFWTLTVWKDGPQESTPKVKPKYLHRPLLVSRSTGQMPLQLSYFRSNLDKIESKNKHQFKSSQRWFCVVLGNRYETLLFSDQFCLHFWFDAIKTGWNVMKDWWDCYGADPVIFFCLFFVYSDFIFFYIKHQHC